MTAVLEFVHGALTLDLTHQSVEKRAHPDQMPLGHGPQNSTIFIENIKEMKGTDQGIAPRFRKLPCIIQAAIQRH